MFPNHWQQNRVSAPASTRPARAFGGTKRAAMQSYDPKNGAGVRILLTWLTR